MGVQQQGEVELLWAKGRLTRSPILQFATGCDGFGSLPEGGHAGILEAIASVRRISERG